jgi:hypothetical protein
MFEIAMGVGILAIILKLLSIGNTLSNPGKKLNQKIVSLNPLKGKTKDAIIAVAGTPAAINTNADGNYTCTWTQDWYSITLGFDAQNICTLVVSQKLK